MKDLALATVVHSQEFMRLLGGDRQCYGKHTPGNFLQRRERLVVGVLGLDPEGCHLPLGTFHPTAASGAWQSPDPYDLSQHPESLC